MSGQIQRRPVGVLRTEGEYNLPEGPVGYKRGTQRTQRVPDVGATPDDTVVGQLSRDGAVARIVPHIAVNQWGRLVVAANCSSRVYAEHLQRVAQPQRGTQSADKRVAHK